jgi:polar amino acid transport system substrate-binding protein
VTSNRTERSLRLAGLVALTLICGEVCYAQNPAGQDPATRVLIVGIKDAPPFSMKAADGDWQGISADLWRRAADQMRVRYRFSEEQTVQALIDGTANGKFDVSIGAITVTAGRSRVLDFTSSFYSTGLGIAVAGGGPLTWTPVIQTFTNFGFVQAVGALLGLVVVVGLLVWLTERRHNEDFGGSVTKGLTSSVWWATGAMTRRGTANFSPQSLPGRIVGVLWIITSIIAIAVFTAAVTSALTVRHLQGVVHGVADLKTVRVGAVDGTSTQDALAELRIAYRSFHTPADGLRALRAREIDAFVYDKPLLAWIVQQQFSSSLELLDTTFDPQQYAFALPNGSPLRASLNVAMLDATQGGWWKQTLYRYFGAKPP